MSRTSKFLGQRCPDECRACAGRDYVNADVLAEAEQNGLDDPLPCPLRLEARDRQWAEAVLGLAAQFENESQIAGDKSEFGRGAHYGWSRAAGWLRALVERMKGSGS